MQTSLIRAAALRAIALVLISLAAPSLMAKGNDDVVIAWDRVVGITPVPGSVGQVIEGIGPVAFPWTIEHGRAQVNLANRRFQFFIRGLAIGAMPTLLSPIGTTGVVTSVRGTLVCTGGGPIIDTDAVELSPSGNAHLAGRLPEDLDYCDPGNYVFLVRIAAVLPGAPNIVGNWLAYGAARRLGRLDP